MNGVIGIQIGRWNGPQTTPNKLSIDYYEVRTNSIYVKKPGDVKRIESGVDSHNAFITK